MFYKFQFDARNRWYAPASVFCSRIAKENKQENTSENNNGSSICDNFSYHFSLCNLDGSGKVKEIVVWCVEGIYFQKAKDSTNDFESCLAIVWAIDVADVICEGCKRPVKDH